MPPPWTDGQTSQGDGSEVTMTAGIRAGGQGAQNGPGKETFVGTRGAPVMRVAGAHNTLNKGQGSGPKGKSGRFSLQQLRATEGIIPVQSGTNQYESQVGMTGFGTPRNTATPVKSTNPNLLPTDGISQEPGNKMIGKWTVQQLRAGDAIIPIQSGTNQYESQRGMTGFGTGRDVCGRHLKRIWELEFPDAANEELQQQHHHE